MHCVSALNAGARGLWKRTMEHSSEAELSAYIRRAPGSIPGVPIPFLAVLQAHVDVVK